MATMLREWENGFNAILSFGFRKFEQFFSALFHLNGTNKTALNSRVATNLNNILSANCMLVYLVHLVCEHRMLAKRSAHSPFCYAHAAFLLLLLLLCKLPNHFEIRMKRKKKKREKSLAFLVLHVFIIQ